jgi:diguanylate cyclase (GGDEF)-like protein/PAS domain S-box-containing protein
MASLLGILYAFISGVLLFSIAITVIREGFKTPLVCSFVLFALCTLVWNFFYAWMTFTHDPQWVVVLYRLSALGWGACPAMAFYYGYLVHTSYGAHAKPKRWVGWVLFSSVPIVWLDVWRGKLMATGFERSEFGWAETIELSYLGNLLFVALGMGGTVMILFFSIRILLSSKSHRARLHALLIAVPLVIVAFLTMLLHPVLPMFSFYGLPPFVQILIGLWLAVIVAVLQKYPVLNLNPQIAADVLLERISDLCFFIDVSERIVTINPAVQHVLGYGPQELLHKKASSFFSVEVCAHCKEGGGLEKTQLESIITTAEGTHLPFAITVNAVTDTLGDAVGYVLVAQEIREIKRLRKLSETDALTGAYNRRKLDNALLIAFSNFRRYHRKFSVIMFDLDRFKSINDCFGHDAGDRVLVEVSTMVRQSIRNDDLYVRMGGEEFIVVCPDTLGEHAANLAERIRKAIMDYNFGFNEGLTCSFGVCEVYAEDSPESLVKRADIALYHAKKAGRNRVYTYRLGTMELVEHKIAE